MMEWSVKTADGNGQLPPDGTTMLFTTAMISMLWTQVSIHK
jgi:hypothetical protein